MRLEERDTPTDRRVKAEPKGVLHPSKAWEKLVLERVLPSADIARFVEHFWSCAWDLRGQPPYEQRVLSYPCVNLVFDRRRPGVFGVPKETFVTVLSDRGAVLGVRFRPGGFRPWLGADVSTITDGVVPFSRWLGGDDVALTEEVLAIEPLSARIARVEELLRAALPEPDPTVDIVHAIVTRIENDASIRRVDDAARIAGLGMRDLQRLFRSYVGVSPKWVIRRARLQEAAFRLAGGTHVDLAALAQELGYFDQAHLTRDFTRFVGRPPASYAEIEH